MQLLGKINCLPKKMLNKVQMIYAEIRQMMHGFGDSSEPLFESAKIIEDVVLQQMKTIVRKACEIADRRAGSKKSNVINAEDLLFLLRKDKVKLQRIVKYIGKYAAKILNYAVVSLIDLKRQDVSSFRNQRIGKLSSKTYIERYTRSRKCHEC